MNELQLHEKLINAYGASSRKFNHFEDAINSIKWDYTYNADGETYFHKDSYVLTIQHIDPFQELWKPCSQFSDGTIIEFN